MAERVIKVITEEGTETRTGDDAESHISKLKLTPTQFVKEVKRKIEKPKE